MCLRSERSEDVAALMLLGPIWDEAHGPIWDEAHGPIWEGLSTSRVGKRFVCLRYERSEDVCGSHARGNGL